MKVGDLMTRTVRCVSPDQTVASAAVLMEEFDIGVLPVVKDGATIGILTDRDIVLRALAAGLPAETPVREVMSSRVECCCVSESLAEAAETMGHLKLRRLPVLDDKQQLVGIVSLTDIAAAGLLLECGEALEHIADSVVAQQPERNGNDLARR
jgi:CBS domain-containing protein